MDLKEEEILGEQVNAHWYYRAKVAALLQNTRWKSPTEVLDVGAGSGFFSRALLRETNAARATCVDIGYQNDRDEMYCGKPISFRRTIKSCRADLVLAMDVIEHVADDSALIRSYAELVSPGTRFILTVPAFNFLWSSHDVFLEHHRRYTLRTLTEAMRKSGLVVDWAHYYYATVFPLAAAVRLLEKLKGAHVAEPKSQLQKHSSFANAVFTAVLTAERPVMRLNGLFGLTVFAGGHKPVR
jgi:2-polyprenyl-3-methyl-5-hydroxy-6-metoxy-1,4-benzoquinol methylase